jgi:hypothetical protein
MDIERFGSSPRLSAAREFSPESARTNETTCSVAAKFDLRSVSRRELQLNDVVHSVTRLLRATVRSIDIVYTFCGQIDTDIPTDSG